MGGRSSAVEPMIQFEGRWQLAPSCRGQTSGTRPVIGSRRIGPRVSWKP